MHDVRDGSPLDTTAEDPRGKRQHAARGRSWQLTLALESARPCQGPLQVPLLHGSDVVIGRGSERRSADQVTHALLTVPDRCMSGAHARVRCTAGAVDVVDLGSRNGTFVNGARVEQARLEDGDVLELGHTFFVVRCWEGAWPSDDAPAQLEGFATLHPGLRLELARLRRIAASGVSALLLGETGTGKEIAARAVHRLSGRRGAFVPVNCAAIPADLVESTLFGHRKGSFTGAVEHRTGLVQAADHGTLFLDEVGDLPLPAQASLLRTLQEGEVLPVGATSAVSVDVRVVAATHRDVDAMAAEETFRTDLLARLSGFRARLSPLRERREDLSVLVPLLLRRIAGERADAVRVEPEAVRALLLHEWRLNVRELEKCLETAFVLAAGAPIALSHLTSEVQAALQAKPAPAPAVESDEDVRRRAEVEGALRENEGNVTRAAAKLGVARTQLQRWMKKYRIDATQFRA